MKDKLLREMLRDYGFNEARVTITDTDVVISGFQQTVPASQLKEEGALIEGTADSYYHNYIYPEGLLPQYERITVARYPDRDVARQGRVQSITVPVEVIYQNDPSFNIDEFIYLQNAINGESTHTGRLSEDGTAFIFIPDVNATYNEKLLPGILQEIQPRIADNFDGPNYVSDLGRIASLITVETISQAQRKLMGYGDVVTDLLDLKDKKTDSSIATVGTLCISKKAFYAQLEKMAREEGLLTKLVRKHLGMDTRRWVVADVELLRNYKNRTDSAARKLQNAMTDGEEPLYISTTTGGHAFAAMVDFKNQRLVLANPLGMYDALDNAVDALKEVTQCNTVIFANTIQLTRDGDVDFNDVCTADAIVLAYMLEEQYKRGGVYAGCLNEQQLRTAHYLTSDVPCSDVTSPKDAEKDTSKKQSKVQYIVTGRDKVNVVMDEILKVAIDAAEKAQQKGDFPGGIEVHGDVVAAADLKSTFDDHLDKVESADESLENAQKSLTKAIESARLNLTSHHKMKYLLANLLVGVLTLGIVPIATRVCTGQWAFFRPANAWKIDKLEQEAKNLDLKEDKGAMPAA